MTVTEYELAVEEAIEERNLRILEVYDLRLCVKFARRRGHPDSIDILLLSWAGRPAHGKFTTPAVKLELTEEYVIRKQSVLFE